METRIDVDTAKDILKEVLDEYYQIKTTYDQENEKLIIMGEIINIINTEDFLKDNVHGILCLIPLFFDENTSKKIINRYSCAHVALNNPKLLPEQVEQYVSKCENCKKLILENYEKRKEIVSNYKKQLDSKISRKNEAQMIISSINLNGIVPDSKIEVFKEFLSTKHIDDLNLIMLLEDITLTKKKNNSVNNIDKTPIQELLEFDVLKYSLNFEKNDEYNYRFRALIDSISLKIREREFDNIVDMLPIYNESEYTLFEFDYIYQSIINNIIDEFQDLKSQVTIELYSTSDLRSLISVEYEELIQTLSKINNIYFSNRKFYEKDEQITNKVDDINTLLYLPSDDDVCYLEKDFKNIPETFYNKMKDLINGYKSNTLARGEFKRFGSDNRIFAPFAELRDDQIRIVLYPIDYKRSVVLGAFQKQSDNDIPKYTSIFARLGGEETLTKEYIDYLMNLKGEFDKKVMKYIEDNARKGTR